MGVFVERKPGICDCPAREGEITYHRRIRQSLRRSAGPEDRHRGRHQCRIAGGHRAIRQMLPILHNRDNGTYEVRPGAHLRIFSGTLDDKDPTHFTIPYQLGPMNGTIDGWLREDAVELRGREGEMGPQSSWKLPVPPKPATAPTTRPAG